MEIKLPKYLKYTIILLGLLLILWIIQTFKSTLMPMAFALLFAMLLLPLTRDLERFKWPRAIAIICSITVVMVILGLVIWFLSIQLMSLTQDLDKIGENFNNMLLQLQDFLHRKFNIRPMNNSDFVHDVIGSLRDISTTFLGSTISMTTGAIAAFTLIPIFVFCLLYYRDHLEQFMYKFVSKDRRSEMNKTISNIQGVVQSYITGLMIVIIIVSLLNSAGLLLLNVKYAIFFGVFASILTIIPYIGIMIGATLPALFTLATTGSMLDAFLVVVVFMVVQFLEGNFITPFVVGSKVSINPFAAIVALLIGGEVWGSAGMILSIPIIATLKVLFDAYPPLNPFGFLLSDIEDTKPKKNTRFNRMFHKIREKARREGREQRNNE